MSEYICTNKFDTNECPNIFVKEKLIRTNVRIYIRDQYIRIFEYSNIFVTLWFGAACPPSQLFLSSSSTRVTTSKLTLFGHNVHKGPAAEGDEDYDDEEKEM